MSLERMPELGTKLVTLSVKLPHGKKADQDRVGKGLRALYASGDFTDVEIICSEKSYSAHRAVLAGQSDIFKEGFSANTSENKGRHEVRIADISNPEAVKFMLDYMYEMTTDVWEDYNPGTQEINKDVLRLAQNFRLPGLAEHATLWLAKDINTGNVVERLAICEEFGLLVLREKILEQLTFNKKALYEVAHSGQITKYPTLMQSMLQLAAGPPEEAPQPKKKAKKA